MKASKKIWGSGLSSGIGYLDKLFKWGEEFDMERLSQEANKGYIVEKIGFRYTLRYQNPQELIFAIDYRDHPDDEYFEIIEKSGWIHVDSLAYIHLFKAPSGTQPLYSDQASQLVKYEQQTRKMGVSTMITVGWLLLIAYVITPWLWTFESELWDVVALILNVIGLVMAVFSIIPFFNYWARVRHIKKGRTS